MELAKVLTFESDIYLDKSIKVPPRAYGKQIENLGLHGFPKINHGKKLFHDLGALTVPTLSCYSMMPFNEETLCWELLG